MLFLTDVTWFFFQLQSYSYLLEKIYEFEDQGYPALSQDQSIHYQNVYDGGYVYFADLTQFQIEKEKNCDLAILDEKIAPLLYGVGAQNNSVYTELFSERWVEITNAWTSDLLSLWFLKTEIDRVHSSVW